MKNTAARIAARQSFTDAVIRNYALGSVVVCREVGRFALVYTSCHSHATSAIALMARRKAASFTEDLTADAYGTFSVTVRF